jgi:hypothetical protein
MILLLFFGAGVLAAGPPPALKDPSLDNFVGDWSVARKIGNGRTIESTLRGEWVLNLFGGHYSGVGRGKLDPNLLGLNLS